MTTPQDWPHPFTAVDGGEEVEVFQMRPDLVDALLAWSGGDVIGIVNGGPLVLLPGYRRAADRMVGLGDFAVRRGTSFRGYRADGFYQQYTPAPAA